MATTAFPLRFKDDETKEMLRLVSEQLGISMTEIAEAAIRKELILLGAGIERQLSEVVAALREYNPQTDVEAHIDAAAEGEALPDPLQGTQIPPGSGRVARPAKSASSARSERRNPKLAKALAAFKQG